VVLRVIIITSSQRVSVNSLALFLKPLSPAEAGCSAEGPSEAAELEAAHGAGTKERGRCS